MASGDSNLGYCEKVMRGSYPLRHENFQLIDHAGRIININNITMKSFRKIIPRSRN